MGDLRRVGRHCARAGPEAHCWVPRRVQDDHSGGEGSGGLGIGRHGSGFASPLRKTRIPVFHQHMCFEAN